jgi:hypothetical protein
VNLKKSQRSVEENRSRPYQEFEGTPLWKAIDKGISDLVENQDLQEMTPRAYVVGHLCKVLTRRKVVLPAS